MTISSITNGESGANVRTALNAVIAIVNPNAVAVSSSVGSPPDVAATARYVEITSAGSGSDEYVNILAPTNPEATVGQGMVLLFKTQTTPGDTVHITGLDTTTLQTVNDAAYAAQTIADLSFNSAGLFARIVYTVTGWCIDMQCYGNNVDPTSSDLTLAPFPTTSGGTAPSAFVKGAQNYGAGAGGDVILRGGPGTPGGNVYIDSGSGGASRVYLGSGHALPDTDPHDSGAVWCNPADGILRQSQG